MTRDANAGDAVKLGFALLLLVPLLAAGCAGGEETRVSTSGDPEADQRAEQHMGDSGKEGGEARTLYDRIGGAERIAAIVDDMTERVIADPRVNFERRNVKKNWIGGEVDTWSPTTENVERFKSRMVEFLSLAAGGPTEYSGASMKEVHDDMHITNNEFDAMIGDIKASMDKLGIGRTEQRDLLAIIETTRKQIVEKP
jgi:hemoglobin